LERAVTADGVAVLRATIRRNRRLVLRDALVSASEPDDDDDNVDDDDAGSRGVALPVRRRVRTQRIVSARVCDFAAGCLLWASAAALPAHVLPSDVAAAYAWWPAVVVAVNDDDNTRAVVDASAARKRRRGAATLAWDVLVLVCGVQVRGLPMSAVVESADDPYIPQL
jgi:hypothetical protein